MTQAHCSAGLRGDWVEIEGSWVLRPPMSAAPARAVIHFLGGAFLGAAPQLTYRLFLENLAAQGFLVSSAGQPLLESLECLR